MLNFFKNTLNNLYSHVTSKLQALFSEPIVTQETLKRLERLFIEADAGINTTQAILKAVQEEITNGSVQKGSDLKPILRKVLLSNLISYKHNAASIYLLVGINGGGKTSCAAKLAHMFTLQGKKVLLAAADTFRAAAVDQLLAWANSLDVPIVTGKKQQDPGSIVFTACDRFTKEQFDILIIDTSGRLQTKINLMHELTRLKNIIIKKLPDHGVTTLLTVDAMLGQNSLDQAEIFHQAVDLNGLLLTKMDGTGKGGIVFAISQKLHIPVAFISYGEQKEAIKMFNPSEYVEQLLDF